MSRQQRHWALELLVCRRDNVLFGDSFALRALRETLGHLKWEVNRCFEWVELGMGLVSLGPREDPEKSAMPNSKANPPVFRLSKNPSAEPNNKPNSPVFSLSKNPLAEPKPSPPIFSLSKNHSTACCPGLNSMGPPPVSKIGLDLKGKGVLGPAPRAKLSFKPKTKLSGKYPPKQNKKKLSGKWSHFSG